MPYTYRNRNNGDVYTLSERDPRLDSLPNWELVGNVEISERDRLALERAAAERALIESAYLVRLEQTRVAAAEQVNAIAAQAALAAPVAIPTVVDRPHTAAKPAAAKPRTREELEAQAAADVANPPANGVLKRAHEDQRSGAVQIGNSPEEHPVGRAALEAAAAGDAEAAVEAVEAADAVVAAPTVVEAPTAVEAAVDAADAVVEMPARNAKGADWVAFAVAACGLPQAEAEGLSRDELVKRFGG